MPCEWPLSGTRQGARGWDRTGQCQVPEKIRWVGEGVHVAQWAKRPPLKLEVPGSNPHGWFNGRAGNRDPFRWLETARGLSHIRLIGSAQCVPGRLAVPRKNGCPNAPLRCLSEETLSLVFNVAAYIGCVHRIRSDLAYD